MATSRSHEEDPEEAVRTEVRRQAAAVLNVVGPVDVDRLCRVLERAGTFAPLADDGWGHDDHRWMIEDLLEYDMDDFHGTADGLIAHVPSLVDGIVLTHLLSADERRRSMLDVGVDLAVLHRYRFRYTLASGGEVRIVRSFDSPELMRSAAAIGLPTDDDASRDGSLAGPDGWLDHFDAGAPLALELSGRTLAITHVDPNRVPTAERSPLVAALDRAARRRADDEHDDYVLFDGQPEHLVLDALVEDPALLRAPDLPVAAAFDHLGLALEQGTLLRWRTPPGQGPQT